MSSYLEILLRVAESRRKQTTAERQVHPIGAALADRALEENVAAFGSPRCSGCYEVAPGVRILPPKSGRDRKRRNS